MTARILPFPRRGSTAGKRPTAQCGTYYHTRSPGELTSRRLYVRGGRTSAEALKARAYELYLDGRPCWKSLYCVGRAGHSGRCKMPKSRQLNVGDICGDLAELRAEEAEHG